MSDIMAIMAAAQQAGNLGMQGVGLWQMLRALQQGGDQDPYMQLGSASDVQNVNPFTDAAIGQINSGIGNFTNLLRGSMAESGGLRNEAAGMLRGFDPAVSYDPMAAQRLFLSAVPGLQQVAQGAVAPVDMGAMRGQISEQVANNYAGNPNSGAFLRTMADAMIQPEMQAQLARQAAVANLFGGLAGQAMSGLQAGTQAQAGFQQGANQQQLGAAQGLGGLGAQAMQGGSIYGTLLGNLMGLQAQMGAPEWWQPAWVNNPNFIGARDRLGLGSTLFGGGRSGMSGNPGQNIAMLMDSGSEGA